MGVAKFAAFTVANAVAGCGRRFSSESFGTGRAGLGAWRFFLTMLVVAGCLVSAISLLIPWTFARGVFVGVGVTVPIAMVTYVVVAMGGTVAPGFGATAETWTISKLRRGRRLRRVEVVCRWLADRSARRCGAGSNRPGDE